VLNVEYHMAFHAAETEFLDHVRLMVARPGLQVGRDIAVHHISDVSAVQFRAHHPGDAPPIRITVGPPPAHPEVAISPVRQAGE